MITFFSGWPPEMLPLSSLAVCLIGLVLLVVLVRRKPVPSLADIREAIGYLVERLDRIERAWREEQALSRQEAAHGDRQARDELRAGLGRQTDSLLIRLAETARLQKGQLDSFSRQLTDLTALNEGKLEALRRTMAEQLHALLSYNTAKV